MADRAVTGRSYCPLCDAYFDADLCPIHGVPTIRPRRGDAPAPKPQPGILVAGRYRLEEVIGRGGMGVVHRAVQLGMSRSVAIKLVQPREEASLESVRRFYREALVSSRLSHPHLVQTFEFGYDTELDLPFIVMEYAGGRTLDTLLESDGPLTEQRALRFTLQIALALAEAHANGVLHRDLKPRNIMVDKLRGGEEHLKVLDFGLAKLIESQHPVAPLTAPGRCVGTPSFMAPEQITGLDLDFRTDLYGLGCVLHAMLTGSAPFDGADTLETMRRQLREPLRCPPALVDGAAPSAALRQVHEKLLAKGRLDRPESTEQVVEMIVGSERAATELGRAEKRLSIPEAVTVPAPLSRRSAPERRSRFSALRIAGAFGTLFALALAAFALLPVAPVEQPAPLEHSAPIVAATPPPRVVVESKRTRVLQLTSDPSGASILLDGRPAGVTPARIECPRAGVLNLAVVLEGYRSQTLALASDDERTTHDFKLIRTATQKTARSRRAVEVW